MNLRLKVLKTESINKKYKLNILKAYLYHFILGIHTVRAVYYAFTTEWGGLTFSQQMILQAYFMFMIFILEIPSGAIADFLGRKKGLMLSALTVVLAAFSYSIIPNIFLFFLAETLWAFSIALISGTDEAFLFSSLKMIGQEDKLPKVMGNLQVVNLVALTISAPLGSIIAEFVSLQFTMTCLGIIYIGAFLTSLTYHEPEFVKKKKAKRYLTIIKDGFKELKKNKILRILCFDRLFINVLIYLLFWTYQPYLTAIGVPLFIWGFILSFMNLTTAGFSYLFPKILKSFKEKVRFLILVDIINGLAFILLGFTTNPFIGIIYLLFIVGFGYPRSLLYTYGINKQIESENRATVLSTINMFQSLSMALLYLTLGFVVETWSIFWFFIINGVIILIFTIFTRVKSSYL
ncbi:MAG: MFS transporter [Candidatus Heimdallarchaeota archaeon]